MEAIETLTELGLTLNQARIYVALLRSERPLTVKEISKITNITRQDVYRILPALQEDGFVEKTITAPTMFKATPLKTGISILIKNRIAKHDELIEKARKISEEAFCTKELTFEDMEAEFVLVPGRDAVVQKINSATSATQVSLDIVSSRKRFPRAVFEFFDARLQALKRGVRIRVVTEKPTLINTRMEEIMTVERRAGAMIRFVNKQPPALLLMFDGKEVMIITSATGNLETSALWSNNPSLIALSKNYFESMWNSAAKANDYKAGLFDIAMNTNDEQAPWK